MPRDLAFGMTGDDVAAVQRLLNYHLVPPRFVPLVVDGIFGPKTKARVIEFQTLNKAYLANMPVEDDAGVQRKELAIDGVVGPNTGRVLLDVRTINLSRNTSFTPNVDNSLSPLGFLRSSLARRSQFGAQTVGDPPAPTPPPAPAPPAPPQPNKVIRFVQMQAGSQVQLAPWVVSPFVLTGQFTWLARNEGKPDFLMTVGGQFASNLGSVNGSWSGQVFGQMGLGNIGLQLGPVDFLNPFVQIMLQKNQGQPAAVGLALGNQINLSLSKMIIGGIEQDRFVIFANLQEVVGIGLDNGQCSAPATQGLIGLGWTVF